MQPTTSVSQSASNVQVSSSTMVQLVSAAILALAIIYGVGFANMEVAHNAAHDARHAFAFPCH